MAVDDNPISDSACSKLWHKMIAIVILGGSTAFCAFIPVIFKKLFVKFKTNAIHEQILSSLMCVGGGILLALSTIHLLPEVKYYFFL